MLHDQRTLDVALAAHDAPRLDAVLAVLAHAPGLTAPRRRDLASAVRRVAGALGHALETAPADPAWLRPRIQRVAPAPIGVSRKTWTNAVSDFRAALRHAGVRVVRGSPEAKAFPSAWAKLHDALPCQRCRIGLTRFMRFCANLGVDPVQVDDATLTAFQATVAAAELRKDPGKLTRDVAVYWNRAGDLVPDWPPRRLTVLDRRHRVALPVETFQSSFRDDLDAWLSTLAAPDITDPDAPLRPLARRTLESRRAEVLGFASALVRNGRVPGTLRSLVDLVEPATVREGLRALMARSKGKPCPSHHQVAITLRSIAKWRVRVSPVTLDALSDIVRRVRPKTPPGMTAKNRARLRQFDDPAAIGALLRLPENLARRAERDADPKRAARRMEMAIAIALLIHCPMRIQNLRQLDLRRHFVGRPGQAATDRDPARRGEERPGTGLSTAR